MITWWPAGVIGVIFDLALGTGVMVGILRDERCYFLLRNSIFTGKTMFTNASTSLLWFPESTQHKKTMSTWRS